MNEALVVETLILIGASALSIALVSRAGLPAMLGYLLAGVLVGPYGFGIVAASAGSRFLADLGLILLMFMVGLEFSWAEMWATSRAVFGAGGLQLVITSACGAVLGHAFGMSWSVAALAGGATAMCSTGIALQQLQEQRELARPHGRIATGILLFQDLATLPFLVVIDSGGATRALEFLPALRQLLAAAAGLGGLLWLGRPMLRVALGWIGRRKSADLFLLAALLLALGIAYIAQKLGAAPTVGAFLAGVAVGESDLRHRVSVHLKPFRDMLLGLFFVTVGMQVDPKAIAASPLQTLAWFGFFVLGKPALAVLAMRAARYDMMDCVRAAIVLAHASEFTLLIVTQAMAAALMPTGSAQAILVAAACAMGLAPGIIHNNRPIAVRALRTFARATQIRSNPPPGADRCQSAPYANSHREIDLGQGDGSSIGEQSTLVAVPTGVRARLPVLTSKEGSIGG